MRKLAAGNWKMNGLGESLGEIEVLKAAFPEPACDVLICPPATLLSRLSGVADGSAIATGPRDAHFDIVVNGKTGTAMQAFGKQLDAAQIAAVIHYQRHAWSNNTDDVTQPRDVIEYTASQE